MLLRRQTSLCTKGLILTKGLRGWADPSTTSGWEECSGDTAHPTAPVFRLHSTMGPDPALCNCAAIPDEDPHNYPHKRAQASIFTKTLGREKILMAFSTCASFWSSSALWPWAFSPRPQQAAALAHVATGSGSGADCSVSLAAGSPACECGQGAWQVLYTSHQS